MGVTSSKKQRSSNTNASAYKDPITSMQQSFEEKHFIPMRIQVAHFTPSSFPLIPVISPKLSKICENSWLKLTSTDDVDEYGATTSGMTAFYRDFYNRLDIIDSDGRFEAILSRHITGNSKTASKGAILIRIIQFVLRIDSDSKDSQYILYMLGKSHAQKAIRPWQYAVFVEILLHTIATRLGTEATNVVMEAWVNLFAYIMKSMLPAAIEGQVVETEMNINTSSEFASGKLADEVADAEEVRAVRKKFKSGTSRGGTSRRSDSINGGMSARSYIGPLINSSNRQSLPFNIYSDKDKKNHDLVVGNGVGQGQGDGVVVVGPG